MRSLFNNSYPGMQAVLDNLLEPIFGKYTEHHQDILNTYPEKQHLAQSANIVAIKRAANFMLDDKSLEVFDITLSPQARLQYSRVNIQRVVRSVMDVYTGALMFFHYEDNKGDWRISFVDKDDTIASATSTKRYTYLVGENQAVRTVTDRFKVLANAPHKTVEMLKEAFSVEALTKEFYKELFDWYQWAIDPKTGITFPNNLNIAEEDREKIDEKIIRLITRLLFVWFIKQKQLIPDNLFKVEELNKILSDFDAESEENGNYYNAILQNLFFATLNKEIKDRAFAKEKDTKREVKTLYRYQEMFIEKNEDAVLDLFQSVPFLNGGLFECLDKTIGMDGVQYAFDGFSRNAEKNSDGSYKHRAFIPNNLFFNPEKGIIPLLERYNFTVEENSLDEIQVALDPELLGKVFENLLGAYNPETQETARKQSGSFYTPREVVDYMVNESLIAFLSKEVPEADKNLLEDLFYTDELPKKMVDNHTLCIKLSEKLRAIKILDPACGSGAFPMGILNKVLFVLEKMDKNNNYSTYDQKLHLIEQCIYGVDIQSIAVQISKLRFFISLICEQNERNTNPNDNYGIKTLPNLETKFVTADTLIGLAKRDQQLNLFENPEIGITQKVLLKVRHEHFFAPTAYKKKLLRDKDANLREKLVKLLEENGDFAPESAKQLSKWNPYDQNRKSPFFDSEWMFGVKNGFDVVIGNPPYFSLTTDSSKKDSSGVFIKHNKIYKDCQYQTFKNNADIYCLFYERGWQLLRHGGHLCYITSNKWMRAGYGDLTRGFLAENTNPKQLIDFGSIQVFESATVDTNILLFAKENNTFSTIACVIKDKELKNLRDFVGIMY